MTVSVSNSAVVPEGTAAAAATRSSTAGPTTPKPRKQRGDGWVALAYLWPGMGGFLLFIVTPLVGSAVISLFDWPLFGDATFVGFANFQKMFGDPTFYTVILNTVIFAFVYTAFNLFVSLTFALWLNTKVKAAGLFRVLFFLPAITPMVANALVWRLLLADDGLLNGVLKSIGLPTETWLSDQRFALAAVIVMSIWQSFGYNVIVLSAGLASVPQEILEAARVDGASSWQRLKSIILPMISPSLFFTMTMTMIGSFQVFVQPQFLTAGGPGESTTTMVMYLYRNGFSFDKLGYASALAWMLFMIVMLITAVQFAGQRKWVNYDK